MSDHVLVPKKLRGLEMILLDGLMRGMHHSMPNAKPPRKWQQCMWCASTMPYHQENCAVWQYQEERLRVEKTNG